MCIWDFPTPCVPSPKSQPQYVTYPAVVPVKMTSSGASPEEGDAVNDAFTFSLLTVIVMVFDASVVAGVMNSYIENAVDVRLLGGNVQVVWNGTPENPNGDVFLSGPADYVFETEIKI